MCHYTHLTHVILKLKSQGLLNIEEEPELNYMSFIYLIEIYNFEDCCLRKYYNINASFLVLFCLLVEIRLTQTIQVFTAFGLFRL